MEPLSQIVERLERRLGAAAGPPVALEGGITNRNYRIHLGAGDYVLRLPGKDTRLLGISREAERIANQAAARLGFAPEVALAEEDCLVTCYLDGRPLEPSEVPGLLDELATALRRIHDSGTSLPVRFWVPDLLESYASTVAARGGELPEPYREAQRLVGRIAAVLPLNEPVPCHNDLLAANLLGVGDRVMLVDWEYAGMGHRLFDLGNLAVNNELDEDDEQRLLAAYYGEPATERRTAALRLMRIMSDAREAAWGVIQGVISELDFDFAGYAGRHFERLAQAAAQPDFEEWLDAATA